MGLVDQGLVVLILTNGCPPLSFAVFLIDILFGLGDEANADRQGDGGIGRMIAGTAEVNPFDHAALRVVVVPNDDAILIGVGLGGDAVIDDEYAVGLLDSADMGFDEPPEVGAGEVPPGEEASNAVVTDHPAEQRSQAGAGRDPKELIR